MVHNPLGLRRVDAAVARLAAVIGVVFFLQSVPFQVTQLPHMNPVWAGAAVGGFVLLLLVDLAAAFSGRLVRPAFLVFAGFYVVALLSWPFAISSVEAQSAESYWLYLLLTIATVKAAYALPFWPAVAFTAVVPLLYGVIRTTPAGGGVDPVLATLDSVYSFLLGEAIVIMIVVIRGAASGVDAAQQNALERYTHAVREHAIGAERVQVDAIVHDSVLTTLLSAARAYTAEAKALAATMAENAIGFLRDAVAAAPDTDVTVHDSVVASRIADAAGELSPPVPVAVTGEGGLIVPFVAAEALYSATVQAMLNSLQHAGGPAVRRRVDIRTSAAGIRIEIVDDGPGFDPAAVPQERLGVRVSIVERLASAGGLATVVSAPGEGTRVTLHWPHPDPPAGPDPGVGNPDGGWER